MPPRVDIPPELLRRSGRARASLGNGSTTLASPQASSPAATAPSTPKTTKKVKATAKNKTSSPATRKPPAKNASSKGAKNGSVSQPPTPQVEFPWDRATQWHTASQKEHTGRGSDDMDSTVAPSPKRKAPAANKRKQKGSEGTTAKRPRKSAAARTSPDKTALEAGEQESEPVATSSQVTLDHAPSTPRDGKAVEPDDLTPSAPNSPLSPSLLPSALDRSPALRKIAAELKFDNTDDSDDDNDEDLGAALAKADARSTAPPKPEPDTPKSAAKPFKITSLPVG